MEGRKKLVSVLHLLLLSVLLVCMLAASTRDPTVGLKLGGNRGARRMSELDCCDDCKCGGDGCTCNDALTGGCADGCQKCHRDHGSYSCRDVFESCPETCDYDYDDGDGDGGAPPPREEEKNSPTRLALLSSWAS